MNCVMCLTDLTQYLALTSSSKFTKLLIYVDTSKFCNFQYDTYIILYNKTWIYLMVIFLLYFLPLNLFFSFSYNHSAKSSVIIGNFIFLFYTHLVSTHNQESNSIYYKQHKKVVYYNELIE